MSAFKAVLSVLFGLFTLYTVIHADCGVCSTTTYAACISETTFKPCPNGQNASDTVIACPANQVCTEEQGICKPADGNFTLGCDGSTGYTCGKCKGRFACISDTKYGFCNENGTILFTATCDERTFCNLESYDTTGDICSCSCTSSPTCSNQSSPGTDSNWENSCSSVQAAGFYSNVADPSCRSYVYCESVSGVMNSILFNCTIGYFDQTSRACTETKPSGCV